MQISVYKLVFTEIPETVLAALSNILCTYFFEITANFILALPDEYIQEYFLQ